MNIKLKFFTTRGIMVDGTEWRSKKINILFELYKNILDLVIGSKLAFQKSCSGTNFLAHILRRIVKNEFQSHKVSKVFLADYGFEFHRFLYGLRKKIGSSIKYVENQVCSLHFLHFLDNNFSI